jgi:hypothetical protein
MKDAVKKVIAAITVGKDMNAVSSELHFAYPLSRLHWLSCEYGTHVILFSPRFLPFVVAALP